MALLPSFSLDVLPMKHSSLAAGILVSSISSGTIASPSSLTPAISSSFLMKGATTSLSMASANLPLIDLNSYPQSSLVSNVSDGPVVQFVLYHPSLFKIEHDFPDIICM